MDHEEVTIKKLDLTKALGGLLQCTKRLWWLALLLAVIGAAISGFLTYRSYTPVYEASITFTVRVTNPLYASVTAYNAKTAEQMAETFPYVITSPAMRQKVMDYLDTSYVPAVTATALENSNIFTMKVRDTDPERAYEVLSAVVACYPDVAEFVVGPTLLVPLDETGVPKAPVNPFNPIRSIVLGAVAGLACFVLYAFLIALTRTSIHDEEQLKNVLNQPCLGNIPVTQVVGRDMVCPLIHKDRGKFGFGEAIRLLRIRTEKEMAKANKKVLIVSSAIPGEGKTTVSVNLAIALARNEKRVLLIDCDMYNPSVERALKPTIGKVLGSFTFGETEKKANVHALTIRNLFTVLLTQGKGSDGRFLSSSDLHQLVHSSRKGFDYVILDTPPCSLLADTAEMAGAADCAVMVVRQDYAPKDKILDGARLLTDSGLPLIGCVINGVTGTQRAGSYNYGYDYGYGSRDS